jgi:polysaccharide export outer membrane protein
MVTDATWDSIQAKCNERWEESSVSLPKLRDAGMVCISVVLAFGIACPVAADAQASSGINRPQEQTVEEGSKANPESPTDPTLKLSMTAALRRMEPDVDEEYTLGAGDEISIAFPGRPELSTKSAIGPDGRITLPLAGPIVIANLTREAAAQKICAVLSAYYTSMSATVDVLKYGSNHITLLGNVKNPGVMFFEQTPTLLEALSRGGVETRPDGSLPDQCVIYREDQVFWVDLQELLTSGSPLADLRLLRNDLIFVPAATRSVTVIGQVQRPGQIPLRRDSTLTTLLGEAGGLNDAGAGSNPEIEIVHRTQGGKTQYIRFNDLLKPTGGMEVSLHPGDVIFVPRSGLSKVGFVMQQISPFVSMGSLATVAAHP